MTSTSSSSGTRPTISRIALRTIGPMVSSSFRVGRTRLIVRPCFSLRVTSRRRSANSAWWKLASPNQRSTRAGTARASSAARSAAARVSARDASCSKVVRPMASRVRTTTTDGRARSGDRLGQRAEEVALPAGVAGVRRRAHDHEVRFLGLAQDGVADVGRLAQEGLAAAVEVLLHEGRERPLRLGADRERDPGRDEVEDHDRRVVVAADGVGIADRELRMRPAADRHEDPLDLLRAALLDDRDVAGGVADHLVDGRRDDRGPVALPVGPGPAAPPEDDQVGLLLGRLPRRCPPRRAGRCARSGGSCVPSGA